MLASILGEDQDEVVQHRHADTSVILRHVERRTVHFGHLFDREDKLACGKPRNVNYVVCAETSVDRLFPKCKDCFGLR